SDSCLPLPQIPRPGQRGQSELAQSDEGRGPHLKRIRVADFTRLEHECAQTPLAARTHCRNALVPGNFRAIDDVCRKVLFEMPQLNGGGQKYTGLALRPVEF